MDVPDDIARKTLDRLRELASSNDPEVAHHKADVALVEFVRALGHNDIADAFDAIYKWYA